MDSDIDHFRRLSAAIATGEGFQSIDASVEQLETPKPARVSATPEPHEAVINGYAGRRDTLPENDYREAAHNDGGRVRFLSEPSNQQKSAPTQRQRATTGVPNRNRRRTRHLSRQLKRTTSMTLLGMRQMSQRTFSAVYADDENPEKGTWSSQFEFFLSCLGYAVGLGNVWRFPYLCHKNGGGAFLIPYFLALTFCGLPILFLELSLGQYSSEGPISIWKVSRLFTGIGVGMVMVSFYLAVYYNVVTGWAFYYIYASVTNQLDWRCCDHDWNTPTCVTFASGCPSTNQTVFSANSSTFSAEEYFHIQALGITKGLHDVGSLKIHLFICLLLAWVLVFVVLMRGIKSFGKAVYFTSCFPYLVLVILFLRAIVEPGAINGIKYYLKPQWEKLLEAEVWGDAVTQIFFSTSICTGGIITLASYNRFHNNCYRDALIIGVGNSMTSLFSGFVVFSILGFMAERMQAEVKDVVKEGPGLTFIIYPQAVTLLPFSPVWATLFFLMLVTLALSSMFPTVENITTALIDQYKNLRPFKFWITLTSCILLFCCGSFLTTGSGMYGLLLMDRFAVGYALVILGLFEVIVLAWIYGVDRIHEDIEAMTGHKVATYWKIVWKYVCPVLLLFCLIFSWIDYEPLKYKSTGYVFPDWVNGMGWLLSFTSFLAIPVCALFCCFKNRGLFSQGWKSALSHLITPAASWGPAMAQNRIYLGLRKFEDDNDDVFS